MKNGIVLVLASLIVFSIIMEFTVRVYTNYSIFYDIEMTKYANQVKRPSDNLKIGHVHRPGVEATLMGVNVKINSDGLRDRDYSVNRGKKHRIIFLGDSLTFGWGVEKEDTFESLLEEKLDRIRPTEILNFGTGNYNSEQEVNLFLEKGVKYNPDLVVLFYFINDAEGTPEKSRWDFLGLSRLITFYWSKIHSLMANLSESKSFKSFYSDLYKDDQEGWINSKKAIRQIAQYCKDNAIRFEVILLPELHNVQDYPLKEEHAKIMAFLKENNINGFDLTPSFSSVTEPHKLWVALDDAHPNAIAHRMIAEFSFDILKEGIK